MTQNAGRLPILENFSRSYSVAANCYGDDVEVAGYYIVCYNPIDNQNTIDAGPYETSAIAHAALADFLGFEA